MEKMLSNTTPKDTHGRGHRTNRTLALCRVIQTSLQSAIQIPRKQRHTVKRTLERLQDEYGFAGSYSTVKVYVRSIGGKQARCSCSSPILQAMSCVT